MNVQVQTCRPESWRVTVGQQRMMIYGQQSLGVPSTLLAPGRVTDASTMPPVKQNLFQVEIIPLT